MPSQIEIAFAVGQALPTTLIFYGLAYIGLRKKMRARGFFRSLASFFLTVASAAAFTFEASRLPKNPDFAAYSEYMSLASTFAPFFLAVVIVWVVHIGLVPSLVRESRP